MILSVSIGNTNIRSALGEKENGLRVDLLTQTINSAEDFSAALEEKMGQGAWECVRGSIVASVVIDKTPIITEAIERKTKKPPKRIDMARLNIDLSEYRGQLGEDRAVCCAAALAEYAPPIIVIDLGTATTVNYINERGALVGGAIFIGVQTGLTALCEKTSLLPRVSDCSNAETIGGDTRGCLVSGAVIGTANMLEGYISRIKAEKGGVPSVIVTGGNAPMVLPYCRFDFVHKPTLLVDGLFAQYTLQ